MELATVTVPDQQGRLPGFAVRQGGCLMLGALFRHAKALSLVGGFLFGMAGAGWSFAFVDRLGSEMARLSDAKADVTGQVRMLNDTASEYFIANQQGDLIFLTANQDRAQKDLAALVYKGNLLDRATPVRNMIGALAIARQLDYRRTYDAYLELNNRARDTLSAENFFALKTAERQIISRGQERVPVLMNGLADLEKAIRANERSQERNRVVGLISSILGNSLLILANLVVVRREPA
jgi:hypothetical protein